LRAGFGGLTALHGRWLASDIRRAHRPARESRLELSAVPEIVECPHVSNVPHYARITNHSPAAAETFRLSAADAEIDFSAIDHEIDFG